MSKKQKTVIPRPLDKFVNTIASHFRFDIAWNEMLELWIIKDEDFNEHFYWSSDGTQATFLDCLKDYFERASKAHEEAGC